MTNGPGREYSVSVNEAIGVVREQIHGAFAEAVAPMEARATVSGQTLDHIADAVIDGTIRFYE